MLNLAQISAQIAKQIDDWCEKEFPSEHRDHMGGSLIGRECDRAIWYNFRWVGLPNFMQWNRETEEWEYEGPRMRRLFQTGHSEEDRFVSYLRGIGFDVAELDPSTGKQWRITGSGGHFGGSLDALVRVPDWLFGVERVILAEFKTYSAKAFGALKEYGLGGRTRFGKYKFEHVAQMNTYGRFHNLTHALYLAKNKDNDNLHIEMREIDHEQGQSNFIRADRLIRSQVAPSRVSNDPASSKCKFCDYKPQCHEKAPLDKNCRSCSFGAPIADAQWRCEYRQQTIPREILVKGCDLWAPVA